MNTECTQKIKATYMTRRDVLSTKQIQKDSAKAIYNTFGSDPSYNAP